MTQTNEQPPLRVRTTTQASRHAWLLFAVVLLCGFALRSGPWPSLAVLMATLLLLIAPRSRSATSVEAPIDFDLSLVVGISLFALATVAAWSPRFIGPTSNLLELGPVVIWVGLAGWLFFGRDWHGRKRTIVVLAVLVTTLVAGVAHITATGGLGIDVLALHVEAAEAIESGLNPYSDAVSVANGSPLAEEGDTIDGYVYPPTTAFAYSLGEWVAGDPRYVSLAAWLGVLALIGTSRNSGRRSLLALVLLASAPGWPFILRAAWTEPLSLFLLAAAHRSWANGRISGVWAGLALGSKQYFAVAAPIIAVFRDSSWKRRAVWMIGAIVASLSVGVLWGPSEFWKAAVEFHLSTPPRPDSLNLVGLTADLNLGLSLPSFLPLLVGLSVAFLYGRRATSKNEWMVALAATLAASFLVSSQAFPNYWFLVMGLAAITLSSVVDPDTVQ